MTGACTLPSGAEVTVVHGLKVEPGAAFLADTAPSTVHIGGTTFSDTSVGGNLVCRGMSPAPQFGDAVEGSPPGYRYSTVDGTP